MYFIQKIILKDFAFRPEQLYLFCYLRFVLSIFGGREKKDNVLEVLILYSARVSLFSGLFHFQSSPGCIKTQFDLVFLLPGAPCCPQNKIQHPLRLLHSGPSLFIQLCILPLVFSRRIFHQVQTFAFSLTWSFFTPARFTGLIYLAQDWNCTGSVGYIRKRTPALTHL